MRVKAAFALSAVMVLSTAAIASAHEGHHHDFTAPGAFSAWDIAVLAFLGSFGLLYLRGALALSRRGAVHPLKERAAFLLGWATLVVSVLPPLDSFAVELFSVHMVQHELMMLVGAPLVIAGRPMSTCLWGLPARWRRAAGATLQARPSSRLWRILTAPLVAWALHGLAIWVWHAPPLYDAAVQHEGVHALQHAMFIGTSALFWWGLLYGRYGRAGYGAAVFYVFTTVVHTGVLGAAVTFAGVPLYPVYAAPAARRGIDLLADQEIAGLLMWIPAGIVLTLLGVALFAAWLGEAERRSLKQRTRPYQLPSANEVRP
jgi:putative membrane protein